MRSEHDAAHDRDTTTRDRKRGTLKPSKGRPDTQHHCYPHATRPRSPAAAHMASFGRDDLTTLVSCSTCDLPPSVPFAAVGSMCSEAGSLLAAGVFRSNSPLRGLTQGRHGLTSSFVGAIL